MAAPALCLPIAAVERDTGVSKDTLRVWERRYGFPAPERDAAGERLYPPEQVQRLRLVKRLLDQGHRPVHTVALGLAALERLSLALASPESRAARPGLGRPAKAAPKARRAGAAPTVQTALAHEVLALDKALVAHQHHELRRLLTQASLQMGLAAFVTDVIAPLNTRVGEAWLRGDIEVFEEHLYTECVTTLLRSAIARIPVAGRGQGPRVLLTTFPQEMHGLGLLMVEALLALEGCECLSLGTQTPVADMVMAVRAHAADVLALSFSPAMNTRQVLSGLLQLRQALPDGVVIWVGGKSPALRRVCMPGVRFSDALGELPQEVAEWRAASRATSPPDSGPR